ncbi:MAG TPA: hypothetical protein VHL09_13245 [Dehalococcoidia bacterium]|nr:hypothetical protein [Dehalococcoidia bacterium]
MNWYLKKEFFAPTEGVEAILIHYVCAPLGVEPNWGQAESRSMAAGEYLKAGVGEVAKYGPAAPSVPQHVHPRLYKKVLKLPNEVLDPATGAYTGNYNLHYLYEVVAGGSREYSPVFVDAIATREVGLVDPYGIIMGVCANWAVYDWDAPQFSPTEEEQFVARFGEDHPLRQFKFYGSEDRDAFAVAKKAFVDTLQLPHRFTVRISAPVGATVRLRFHVGNWGLAEHERWEDYWLDESFVMTRDAEPFVATPLGTTPSAAPLSTVAPELLAGNPYAPLLPASLDEGLVAGALRQVEEVLSAARAEDRALVAAD